MRDLICRIAAVDESGIFTWEIFPTTVVRIQNIFAFISTLFFQKELLSLSQTVESAIAGW
jgi:hypothetical protein